MITPDDPDPDLCVGCDGEGCADCCLNSVELDELEALCHHCIGAEGWVDPKCGRCDGTGRIDAPEHPDWCSRCGMTGRCPDCDPDTYLDARRDR